jgi:putative ABC transport system substrate-binding protein
MSAREVCRIKHAGETLMRLSVSCLALLLSLAMTACSISPEKHMQRLSSESDDGVRKVLVLNSNQSVERYQIAERYFMTSIKNREIIVMDLQGKQKPVEYIQDKLNSQRFDLVYAIGAKALGSVNLIDPDLPVVYSAVLNWRRFRQQENYFGISSELSPQVQLTWFKYFFPEINSIGVLYSHENAHMIEEAAEVAKNLGINLVSTAIRSRAHLKESASQLLKQVDAMWLVSDSQVLSSVDKVKQFFVMADQKRIPVLTYNPVFVEMGATMSLAADLPTIGRQAALMADEILERKLPDASIQFPVGSRIMLNSQKIREYGLQLNAGALDSVDEIYP